MPSRGSYEASLNDTSLHMAMFCEVVSIPYVVARLWLLIGILIENPS